MSKRLKQSFIIGSLTSSVGIFVSKMLGLLYIVPFTALAGGEGNMVFYSIAYTYYDLLLQICSAGLPFAIAALVAKYASKNDYKTVVIIRQLSFSLLLFSGFFIALLFITGSGLLAKSILGDANVANDIVILKNVFWILSLAIILVPLLSFYRGFYQGLKELQVYAFSQVVEQLTRIVFLLGLGYLCVTILKLDSIYAIYMAVASTSIAALIAILYYRKFDKANYPLVLKAAKIQSFSGENKAYILKELFTYGIPYLMVSILGNSMNIVNNNFFMSTMHQIGQDYNVSKILLGIIQVNTNKITSIPQVLAIGFSSGIVPYLTTSLESHDYDQLRKNVTLCLETVLYIALPICFAMFVLAKPIYYVMYGDRNLEYGSVALMYSSLLAFTGTISPISTSMMMTLKFRQKSLLYLAVGFGVKCISFFIMMHAFGWSGAILSSALTGFVVIFLNFQHIANRFNVSYRQTFVKCFKMLLALIAVNGGYFILQLLNIDPTAHSRLVGLLWLGLYGIVGIIIYLYVTISFKLPQSIFNLKFKNFFKKVKHG